MLRKYIFFERDLEFCRVWVLVVFAKTFQKENFSKYFWRWSRSTQNGPKRVKNMLRKYIFFGRNFYFFRVWDLVVFAKILQKDNFSKYFWRCSRSTQNGLKRVKKSSENTFFWAGLGILSVVDLGRLRQNSSERKFFKVL